jgi:hypothetical protein
MDLLTTPMKYKFNSLIGNWNEEKQLEEHKFTFYIFNCLLNENSINLRIYFFMNIFS